MNPALFIAAAAVLVGLRLLRRRRRRSATPRPARDRTSAITSSVGLVAAREVRERFRAKIFRIGTVVVLAVVAAAILIPKLDHSTPQPERVGVVGPLSSPLRSAVVSSAKAVGTTVRFVAEPDRRAAEAGLRDGRLDVAVLSGRALVVDTPLGAGGTSTSATFVRTVATGLGIERALKAAGLTPAQTSTLTHAKAVPIKSLQPGKPKGANVGTSVIGLILTFVMLTQYNTWILVGVMEEKSSRVVEVLLAAVRPIQLLGGKVLGIGMAALAQATVIVAFALVLAEAVGSSLLKGTAPVELVATLVWLFLGYAFYSWVYAAAGSMAERQAQVQTLALPLSLPIIFAYIVSLTAAEAGNASLLVKVLAYLPPTAPFAMPVLVGLSKVSWVGFVASVAISIVCTVGVAALAAAVYRRAILRTGNRLHLRQLLPGAAGR
jgi:ABC-2 type transport system permease protein